MFQGFSTGLSASLSGRRHEHGGLPGWARLPLWRHPGGPLGSSQGRHQSCQVRSRSSSPSFYCRNTGQDWPLFGCFWFIWECFPVGPDGLLCLGSAYLFHFFFVLSLNDPDTTHIYFQHKQDESLIPPSSAKSRVHRSQWLFRHKTFSECEMMLTVLSFENEFSFLLIVLVFFHNINGFFIIN